MSKITKEELFELGFEEMEGGARWEIDIGINYLRFYEAPNNAPELQSISIFGRFGRKSYDVKDLEDLRSIINSL